MKQVLKYYLDQKPLSNSELENMIKSKMKFTDELFPPNRASLLSADKNERFLDQKLGLKIADKFMKSLKYEPKWIRISEMPELNQLYDEKNFLFESILQGAIGDCYLISALCEISQYPKLLINNDKLENSINILHRYNKEVGYYEFKLFIDGEYQLIILDDYIPYDEEIDDISFVKTSKNFYWVCLVEKAFAKILGGYSNIININNKDEDQDFKKFEVGAKTDLAFQILTGFLPERFRFKEYDKDFIYKKIYNEGLYQTNSTKNEILITTGSISEKDGVLEENYIPYEHSFSILDIKTILVDKNEIKLLLLNNPWGKNIYNSNIIGNYIQDSKNVKMKELNKFIQYNIDSSDGTFWIDFDTFFECFNYVSLCKILTASKIYIYKFEKEIFYQKPFIFDMKILEDETDINLSILYERNKYDRKNEKKNLNFYFMLNKINNNKEVENSFSIYSKDEINVKKLLNKGYYHIWMYLPQNDIIDKSSFKIVFNKNIIINFNKFDNDFKYVHQISKEIILIKNKDNKNQKNNELNCIKEFNIIEGFFIIYIQNKVQDKFKLEYTIEKKGNIEIITKGFENIGNNKIMIEDTLNQGEAKIYLMVQKEIKDISVSSSYKYVKGSQGKVNTYNNCIKDLSYYNLSLNNNDLNKDLNGIKFMIFNTPEHKKAQNKIYQILNSYDDDNLIKGLNKDRGNKNRQVRAINQQNNIHSFGEFKNSYQNQTYSNQNIHGFKNKINEKLEIKEEKNKYFYLKNENNSKLNFEYTSKKKEESIFNNDNQKNSEMKNENNELNDFGLISKFIDSMELMEKQENPNVSYMEVRRKYSKIWNELKDEDKMIFSLFYDLEKNK